MRAKKIRCGIWRGESWTSLERGENLAYEESQFVYSQSSSLTNHFSSSGALYNKDTESLKSVLEDVFRNELPRILKTNEYRLVLTPLKVDGKDLLSKGM